MLTRESIKKVMGMEDNLKKIRARRLYGLEKYDVSQPLPHRTEEQMNAVPEGDNYVTHAQCEEALKQSLRKEQ